MMEYLSVISSSVYERYNTLEKNIKSKSNSYYDSYLNLVEETVKRILDSNGVLYDSTKTCGQLLKLKNICDFFVLNNIGVETIDKLCDYIRKCNKSKHTKEMTINIDSITNQMKVYHTFTYEYLTNKNLNIPEFDMNYYLNIFGESEAELKKYQELCKTLQAKLDYNKDLLSSQEASKISEANKLPTISGMSELEVLRSQYAALMTILDTNNILREKIEDQTEELEKIRNELNSQGENAISNQKEKYSPSLKEIIYNSKKKYRFTGTKKFYFIYKYILVFLLFLEIIMNFLLGKYVNKYLNITSITTLISYLFIIFVGVKIVLLILTRRTISEHELKMFSTLYKYEEDREGVAVKYFGSRKIIPLILRIVFAVNMFITYFLIVSDRNISSHQNNILMLFFLLSVLLFALTYFMYMIYLKKYKYIIFEYKYAPIRMIGDTNTHILREENDFYKKVLDKKFFED